MSTTITGTATTFSDNLSNAQREALYAVAATQGYVQAVLQALTTGAQYDIAEVLTRVDNELGAALSASHCPGTVLGVQVPFGALALGDWASAALAWRLVTSVTVLDEDEADEYLGGVDLPPGSHVVDVELPDGETQRLLLANYPAAYGKLAAYEATPCRRCGEHEACGEAYEVDHRYDASLDDVCLSCLPAAYDDWEPSEAQLQAQIDRAYGHYGVAR